MPSASLVARAESGFLLHLALLFSLGLLAGGCNIERPYLLEPLVYAAPTQVFLNPPTRLLLTSRTGLFYFTTPDNVPNVSLPLTEIFYQQFLKKQAFYDLRLIPQTYSTLEEALRIGRLKGYDLILLGQVPYFLDSGTISKSGLQIDLRIIEVKSGTVIGYLSDAVGAEPSPMLDFIIWDTKPKSSPSVYALAQVLAARVAAVLTYIPEDATSAPSLPREIPPPTNLNAASR
ncbi:MAG: hypothetical protein BZ151_04070 [Desulfobacca sp. 4484_104]|nr:MAG: hypothetical protein BZ151_04070 [Desulfobacca sp. 4484_104]